MRVVNIFFKACTKYTWSISEHRGTELKFNKVVLFINISTKNNINCSRHKDHDIKACTSSDKVLILPK